MIKSRMAMVQRWTQRTFQRNEMSQKIQDYKNRRRRSRRLRWWRRTSRRWRFCRRTSSSYGASTPSTTTPRSSWTFHWNGRLATVSCCPRSRTSWPKSTNIVNDNVDISSPWPTRHLAMQQHAWELLRSSRSTRRPTTSTRVTSHLIYGIWWIRPIELKSSSLWRRKHSRRCTRASSRPRWSS